MTDDKRDDKPADKRDDKIAKPPPPSYPDNPPEPGWSNDQAVPGPEPVIDPNRDRAKPAPDAKR